MFIVIPGISLNRRSLNRDSIEYFQGERSRSRDISTSLSRTSSTKFLRFEGFKMVDAKYC